ncbi:hypothetical protein WLZ34_02430 [Thermogladius sp. KZ2Tp1]|uniref:hypothetical protein n=1 Tax=Thermogladius sp. KZ2Tp1 TaxID=3136289 RepID=UPI003DA85ACB
MRVVEALARGRHVVYTSDINVVLKLVARFVEETTGGRVNVVAERGVTEALAAVLTRGLERVVLSEDPGEGLPGPETRLVCVDKPCFDVPAENVVVFLTRGVKAPRFYTRHYLRRLDWGVYVFETPSTGERVVLTASGGLAEGTGLAPLEERALELVKKAMLDYGELRVGDVLFLIEREMGVSKNAAREILSKLVSRRYLRVRRGVVELA